MLIKNRINKWIGTLEWGEIRLSDCICLGDYQKCEGMKIEFKFKYNSLNSKLIKACLMAS